MNAWSNINISPNDPEIYEIDKFENSLGELSDNIRQIRDLITRFEVCHFKYQRHIENIKKSILYLTAFIIPGKIVAYHLSKSKESWKNDKTGRSEIGNQYLVALREWLSDIGQIDDSGKSEQLLILKIKEWLSKKNPEKERLVRLVIARLTWDWKSYEALKQKEGYKDLEYQACRIDICHYAFPSILDSLLQDIGELKYPENSEGCGSFNTEMMIYSENQFSILCNWLKSEVHPINKSYQEKDGLTRIWLVACLAKTLKEQIGLKKDIPDLTI